MAKFFIDRPVFAWVIAILVMLGGILSITQLPIQQYPTIAPPAVRISATYPGASASILEQSVTQVIEQNMTGLDNLLYMSSTSDSSGNATITLTFAAGTDPDIAQVQVQNKLSLAEPTLPQTVRQQGLAVTKSTASILLVVGFINTDNTMTGSDLADFANSRIKDPLSRTNGVGEITAFGAQYAMRIWLKADKLTSYGLTTGDVRSAIEEQNSQSASGALGGQPAADDQELNVTIISQTRFTNTEQFENILLKVNPDGSKVRLKDVARVELGAENYNTNAKYNNHPSTGMAISLSSGANALDTAQNVRSTLDGLKSYIPDNVKIIYPYDTTAFIKISIEEVVHTLVEAIILVFLVMYLFLGNIRATLIPTIAVPVVLLGTFGVMEIFGYSINVLTMFGLVLAIGLLVDDAIVVVENVERLMEEQDLTPREAARESMDEITGALVGIALVLSAVFVPMAFFGGSTGAIYRQFSLTIVSAMALSVMCAIILTPALCATILKKPKKDQGPKKGFFPWFNKHFTSGTEKYARGVEGVVKRPAKLLIIYAVIVAILAFLYVRLPTSFLPEEDQGVFLTLVQLPKGSTQQRTDKVMSELTDYYLKNEKDGIESVFGVSGFSFAGRGQNMGLAFVKLKPWEERGPKDSVDAIIGRSWAGLSQIRDAQIIPINIPPIQGLGTAAGFDVYLQDRDNKGHAALMQARNQLLGMASKESNLTNVRPNGMEDVPYFNVNVDREKAESQGVSISSIYDTLGSAWGSSYINDFIDRGRVKQVYIQAEAEDRMMPSDLSKWYVRNDDGEMAPFSSFVSTEWSYGSPRLERYNGVPAVNIQGEAAPGHSTGEAMQIFTNLVDKLPPGFSIEWTGMSYQERLSGSQAPMLYMISLIVVFLCLAALYESWSVPFAVMLVVPLGVFGALVAATLRGLSNDVYFQVGLLTTVGLSAKNAILIVEFAKAMYDEGKGLIEATVEAARMRLRPIIMTSMAFILGVMPLALSTGAGAKSRVAIGTGVVGGMLAATILAIFFIPMFYVLVMKLSNKLTNKKPDEQHAVDGQGE